jgi:peptidoglycan/LPS O-acetylase OafA/YrhL
LDSGVQKNSEIERLRGLAVIMTIVAHAEFFKPLIPSLAHASWAGVDLFFVISGFLVSQSLLKLLPDFDTAISFLDKLKMSRSALKLFFVKRAFRILPAALVWILVPFSIACLGLLFNLNLHHFLHPTKYIMEFVSFVTGTYNYALTWGLSNGIGVYWSLSVEEHFYFLLPFFFIAASSNQKRLFWIIISILLIVFVIRPWYPFTGPAGNLWMWERITSHNKFDAIFSGVILGLLKQENFWTEGYKFKNATGAAIFSYLLFFFLWTLPAILPFHFMHQFGFVSLWVISGILVYLASLGNNYILGWKGVSSSFEYLGSRSYSLYLNHNVVYVIRQEILSKNLLPSEWVVNPLGVSVQFLVCFLIMILFAEITYRFIETRFIELGRQFRKLRET